MQKRINRQVENLLSIGQRNYRSDVLVFIDAEVIRKVKCKAIQMQEKRYLHFTGIHYQQCMEELGLWNVSIAVICDEKIYLESAEIHKLRRMILHEKVKWFSRKKLEHYQSCLEELGLWEL